MLNNDVNSYFKAKAMQMDAFGNTKKYAHFGTLKPGALIALSLSMATINRSSLGRQRHLYESCKLLHVYSCMNTFHVFITARIQNDHLCHLEFGAGKSITKIGGQKLDKYLQVLGADKVSTNPVINI